MNFPIINTKRDAFYDILWQWEKNHKYENWNFAENFAEKIKNLVSFKDNMTNFLKFVKLFQEQLVLVIIFDLCKHFYTLKMIELIFKY